MTVASAGTSTPTRFPSRRTCAIPTGTGTIRSCTHIRIFRMRTIVIPAEGGGFTQVWMQRVMSFSIGS
jgi:hypothetical protein